MITDTNLKNYGRFQQSNTYKKNSDFPTHTGINTYQLDTNKIYNISVILSKYLSILQSVS
jgi:hypothetical protein